MSFQNSPCLIIADGFIDVEHSTAAPVGHGASLQSSGLQYEGFEPSPPEEILGLDPVRKLPLFVESNLTDALIRKLQMKELPRLPYSILVRSNVQLMRLLSLSLSAPTYLSWV